MILRKFNKEEIKQIYETDMQNDFPPAEIKPLSAIFRMIDAGNYEGKGLYKDGELLAYVFISFSTPKDVALIDYLAVCSKYRGKGIGGQLISAIRQDMSEWRGIILEVEDPEYAANETDYNIQCRRINFYQNNNVELSTVKLSLFGVPFRIMHFNDFSLEKCDIRKMLENIYHVMFPNRIYEKSVKFEA